MPPTTRNTSGRAWIAPNARQIPPVPYHRCNERNNQQAQIGRPPHLIWVRGYIGLCEQIPPAAAPAAGLCQGPINHPSFTLDAYYDCGPCLNTIVCDTCHTNQQDHQAWLQEMKQHIGKPPGTIPLADRGKYWWTRMCDNCEQAEQALINARAAVAPGPGAPIPVAAVTNPGLLSAMKDYPRNTCTCMKRLDGTHRLCTEHLVAEYLQMQDTSAIIPLRKQLERNADRNRQNLERWQLHTGNNQTWRANRQTLAMRNVARKYRACRCGAEVVRYADACIWQCMACEGIIQLRERDDPVPGNNSATHGRDGTAALAGHTLMLSMERFWQNALTIP